MLHEELYCITIPFNMDIDMYLIWIVRDESTIILFYIEGLISNKITIALDFLFYYHWLKLFLFVMLIYY